MMNGRFLGIALLAYGVLRGVKGLVVGVKDYSFKSIDLNNGTVQLNLNLALKNPLLFGMTLKSIQGEVYIQGNNAGYVNTTVDYYLGGGRTHIIPIVVNLTLNGLSTALLQNIQSGDIRTLTISFSGKVFVGTNRIGFPVNIDLNYNDLTA